MYGFLRRSRWSVAKSQDAGRIGLAVCDCDCDCGGGGSGDGVDWKLYVSEDEDGGKDVKR